MAPTALAEAPTSARTTVLADAERSVFEDTRIDLNTCPDCETHLVPTATGVACDACGWTLRF